MSGILGQYTFGPASEREFHQMATSLGTRGNRIGYWSEGPISLAMAEWSSRIPGASALPYQTDECVVAADIRLDYVPDLLSRLRPCIDVLPTSSDTEILAAAYHQWGEECLHFLEGDYAFLLWDRRYRRLFGARSITGLRPLVFSRTGQSIVCASEAKQVLESTAVSTHFDDSWIAHWLAKGHDSWNRTAYRAIEKLPPGYSLIIDEQGVRIQAFWQRALAPSLPRYRRQQDCTEHIRTLLFESVQSRLRGATACMVDISGGLDSSSIACIAGSLHQSGVSLPSLYGLHGYSSRFPENDDRALASHVAETTGIPVTYLSYDASAPLTGLSWARPWSDTPAPPTLFFARYYGQIWSMAHQWATDGNGLPIAHLRGDFGDQLFDASPRYLGILAEEHRYLHLLREIWAWQQSGTVPAGRVVNPRVLLPRWQQQYHESATRLLQERAPWLRPHAVELSIHDQHEDASLLRTQVSHPLARHLYRAMLEHDDYIAMQSDGILASGIETREPFMDGRLIAFMMNCPPQYQLRFGVRKFLLREAMRGILPESIRTRTGKGRIARLLFEGIRHSHQELRELVVTLPPELEPYLNAARLAQAVDHAARGGALDDQVSFFSALALVIWAHRLPWCNGRLPHQDTYQPERR